MLRKPNLLYLLSKSAEGRNTTEVSQLPTILSMPEKVRPPMFGEVIH